MLVMVNLLMKQVTGFRYLNISQKIFITFSIFPGVMWGFELTKEHKWFVRCSFIPQVIQCLVRNGIGGMPLEFRPFPLLYPSAGMFISFLNEYRIMISALPRQYAEMIDSFRI